MTGEGLYKLWSRDCLVRRGSCGKVRGHRSRARDRSGKQAWGGSAAQIGRLRYEIVTMNENRPANRHGDFALFAAF